MSLVGIQFKFPKWEKKLKAAEERLNLFVAAQMQANRGMLFDQEGAYNGHQKWAPLVFRAGMILSNRGVLRKSMSPSNPKGRPGSGGIVRFVGDQIVVGTQVAYARMMNDGTTKMPGGVLKAKPGKVLRIPLPSGAKANEATKSIKASSSARTLLKLEERARKMKDLSSESATKLFDRMAKVQEKMRRGEGPQNAIFRKSVKIPARPFDTWTAEDQTELSVALRNKIVEILNL